MKIQRLISLAILLVAFGVQTSYSSNDIKESKKELESQSKMRREKNKIAKKEMDEKASKEAKKAAKELQKAGWKAAPGALPLEKQLDKSYLFQYEYDEEGFPQYIMAEGMSIGGNYDAAKLTAMEIAKQNLASQIQSETTALIETTMSNYQNEQEDVTSLTKSIMASKTLISQQIGRVIPIVEIYRDVNNKNKEVLVRLAYSMDMVKKIAKNALRKELESRGDELHENLDDLLNW